MLVIGEKLHVQFLIINALYENLKKDFSAG